MPEVAWSLLPGLGFALAGCTCLYLASPHQAARRSPWPARPARGAAGLLLLASLASLGGVLQVVPAVFLCGVSVMAFLVLLPFFFALRGHLRSRSHDA